MNIHEVSTYHIMLRVSALTLALVLLFDSGLLTPVTKQLSDQSQAYLANVVSVGAAVAPTDLNTITTQLSLREQELDAREAAVAEREISVGIVEGGAVQRDLSTYVLSIILFILVVLIVLNYVLDFVRDRQLQALKPDHGSAA